MNEAELNAEVTRLRSTASYNELLIELEMESRELRRQRISYSETLRKLADDKAERLIASEGSNERLSGDASLLTTLIALVAVTFVHDVRDGR